MSLTSCATYEDKICYGNVNFLEYSLEDLIRICSVHAAARFYLFIRWGAIMNMPMQKLRLWSITLTSSPHVYNKMNLKQTVSIVYDDQVDDGQV